MKNIIKPFSYTLIASAIAVAFNQPVFASNIQNSTVPQQSWNLNKDKGKLAVNIQQQNKKSIAKTNSAQSERSEIEGIAYEQKIAFHKAEEQRKQAEVIAIARAKQEQQRRLAEKQKKAQEDAYLIAREYQEAKRVAQQQEITRQQVEEARQKALTEQRKKLEATRIEHERLVLEQQRAHKKAEEIARQRALEEQQKQAELVRRKNEMIAREQEVARQKIEAAALQKAIDEQRKKAEVARIKREEIIREQNLAKQKLDDKLRQQVIEEQRQKEEQARIEQERLEAKRVAREQEIARQKAEESRKKSEEMARRERERLAREQDIARQNAEEEERQRVLEEQRRKEEAARIEREHQETERIAREEKLAKQKAEEERKQAEEVARIEQQRIEAERVAREQDIARQKAEDERKQAEEAARIEQQRIEAERVAREQDIARQKAEDERKQAEETARIEQQRIEAEEERKQAEEVARIEQQRIEAERVAREQDIARQKAEEERKQAEEVARIEQQRIEAERVAREQDIARQKAEEERKQAEEVNQIAKAQDAIPEMSSDGKILSAEQHPEIKETAKEVQNVSVQPESEGQTVNELVSNKQPALMVEESTAPTNDSLENAQTEAGIIEDIALEAQLPPELLRAGEALTVQLPPEETPQYNEAQPTQALANRQKEMATANAMVSDMSIITALNLDLAGRMDRRLDRTNFYRPLGGVWVEYANNDVHAHNGDYLNYRSKSSQITLGNDEAELDNGVILGGTLTHAKNSNKYGSLNGSGHLTMLTAYAKQNFDEYSKAIDISYGWSSSKIADSKFKRKIISVGMNFAYDFEFDDFKVTPIWGLRYHRVSATGGEVNGITVRSPSLSLVAYHAGVKVSSTFNLDGLEVTPAFSSYYVTTLGKSYGQNINGQEFQQKVGTYFYNDVSLSVGIQDWKVSAYAGFNHGKHGEKQNQLGVKLNYYW